jgi:hypothetical protein
MASGGPGWPEAAFGFRSPVDAEITFRCSCICHWLRVIPWKALSGQERFRSRRIFIPIPRFLGGPYPPEVITTIYGVRADFLPPISWRGLREDPVKLEERDGFTVEVKRENGTASGNTEKIHKIHKIDADFKIIPIWDAVREK